MALTRGGKRIGAGRKTKPLIELKIKRSVTLSLVAIQAVEERRLPDEPFSAALERILSALPAPTAPA